MNAAAPGPGTGQARQAVLARRGWQWFSRCCFALAALVGIGALAVGAGVGGGATVSAEARPLGPVPDYSARVLGTQERVRVADLADQVLLVNTWATWCDPCREEMPDLQAIHQRYREAGLRVVGVNIDEGVGDEGVRSFLDKVGVTFETWRDPGNRFAKDFRVLGPPETFLVADGTILRHWRGQMDPAAPANLPSIQAALGLGTDGAESVVATAGLLAAFGAGLLSVLSPCVLPLIPTYAAVITAVRLRKTRQRAPQSAAAVPAPAGGGPGPPPPSPSPSPSAPQPVPVPDAPAGRGIALRAGLAFVAGFSAVFITLGVAVNRAGDALADNRIWLTRIGGVVLVVLGLHLLGLLRMRAAERERKLFKPGTGMSGRGGYLGVFVVGVAFAAGWSPCVGPVLAGILTLAASGGSSLDAAVLMGAYCAGLAIPFLGAALALDRFLAWSAGLKRSWLPIAERVSGVLVVGVGVLLLTGIFSRMAEWLA